LHSKNISLPIVALFVENVRVSKVKSASSSINLTNNPPPLPLTPSSPLRLLSQDENRHPLRESELVNPHPIKIAPPSLEHDPMHEERRREERRTAWFPAEDGGRERKEGESEVEVRNERVEAEKEKSPDSGVDDITEEEVFMFEKMQEVNSTGLEVERMKGDDVVKVARKEGLKEVLVRVRVPEETVTREKWSNEESEIEEDERKLEEEEDRDEIGAGGDRENEEEEKERDKAGEDDLIKLSKLSPILSSNESEMNENVK
jgi:hypothetical protein